MADKEQFITITERPDKTFAVWFDEYDLKNRKCFTATAITKTERQLYELDGEPFFTMSEERTQAVMESLWEMGLRPKEYDGKETE